MAAIYLRHLVHGDKVACSEIEAAADERNGWTRFVVPAPVAADTDVVVTVAGVGLSAPQLSYIVTSTNGMQPENAMPKPRKRRSVVE